MRKINIIMIAHDQINFVKQELKAIQIFAGIQKDDIVVVDNASKDGLKEWLGEQRQMNFISFDEKIEGYGVILNMVIREFELEGDIFVFNPRFILLPGCLEEMQSILHSEERIGAVCASSILSGTDEGTDFLAAVESVKNKEQKSGQKCRKIGLEAEAVMFTIEMFYQVGGFDERLILPHSAMMDFFFMGITLEFKLYECKNAFLYETGRGSNCYVEFCGVAVDRPVLKEKWEMNYFNDRPNDNLINVIDKGQRKFNILEVGCDCGVNLLEVKKRFSEAVLYGVEINPCAAGIANHVAKVKTANIEDKNLDFGDVKFDYIMFGDVLEHLRDPEGTILYCRELLKEGGNVIACIPNLMHYTVMRELINGNFAYQDTGLLDRTHIHFFTYYEIKNMFERCGFTVENINSVVSTLSLPIEDTRFIQALTSLSDRTNMAMYCTFQYIVSAMPKKEVLDESRGGTDVKTAGE